MYNKNLYRQGEKEVIDRILKREEVVSLDDLKNADELIFDEIEEIALDAEENIGYWEDSEAIAYFCICEEIGTFSANDWLERYHYAQVAI